jgi:quinol monooxygenase YgiN
MRYGSWATIGVRPEQRDAVVALLTKDDGGEMRAAGCDLYVVGISPERPDAVHVTEVWTSREAHRASLELPSVKAAIAETMPMLTGEFQQVEFSVAGGIGVPEQAAS